MLEHELDDEAVDSLRATLAENGIEIAPADDDLDLDLTPDARGTTDSLSLFLADVGRFPLLTAAEEVALAKRVERGDKTAKERMVNANLRLVVSIAKRYQGHDVPLLDLVQDGVIGLNRAVEKFDWRKGYKFSTYATWWIRQACQRAVANQSSTIRVPVHVQERQVKLRRASQKLEAQLGREATAEELATATAMPLHHVEEALEVAEASVSLNRAVGSEGDGELGDLFADETAADPFDEAAEQIDRDRVRTALAQLPERERRVLELRFGFDGEGLSLEQIGRELGITRERTRQIESVALTRLEGLLRRTSLPGGRLAEAA